MPDALYDQIGRTYASTRRSDPRIAATIRRALGDATTVVNVGAGTGSYEPADLSVCSVEPSRQMIDQRLGPRSRVVQAAAEALPFRNDAFDAGMAVLTLHHWESWTRGLDEMRRVASRLVILSFEPGDVSYLWLTSDYFPEIVQHDRQQCPSIDDLVRYLGGDCEVQPLPVPHDCVDGFLAAHWRRPEAYLDPRVRAGMSAFALLEEDVASRGLARLEADLKSGAWDQRFGHLRAVETLDVGYRLVVTN